MQRKMGKSRRTLDAGGSMRSGPAKLIRLVFLCLLILTAFSCYSNGESGKSAIMMGDDLDFAQVVFVKATFESKGTWRFDVSVKHNDEGWDHYANRWEVVDPNSLAVLGERVLVHPHDNEQPFTRSASGVAIPAAATKVLIRAKCNLHGFDGQAITVDLDSSDGDGYTVAR